MTFTPEPGQQVRVVKCRGAEPHAGRVGAFKRMCSDDESIVHFDDGDSCLTATELAPVFVVGQPVTPEMGEPPVGSTVRDDEGYEYSRYSDFCNANWQSGNGKRRRWSELLTYGVTLVSLPDAQNCLPDILPLKPEPTPQPQTREVPLSSYRDLRDGDAICGIYRSGPDPDDGIYLRTPDSAVGCGHITLTSVTRRQNPLPTTPGSVGVATVRGVPGVQVALSEHEGWYGLLDRLYMQPADITDYQPLLDGENR